MVKMFDTCKTHMIICVPAVIKAWGHAVRHKSLAVCYGQRTGVASQFVGITGSSVCVAAYHCQMDFSTYAPHSTT